MKVLITGAFGYFGLALVRALAPAHELIAVGRKPRPDAAKAVRLALPSNVEVFECDVRQLTVGHVIDVDAVVHLAGGGAPGGDMPDAIGAVRDNLESAMHVAAIAPRGARLLLASSIYVYGRSEQPSREDDPRAPDTLYGALKVVAEAAWRQAGGISLRFSHIYGAGSGVDFQRDGVTERLARAGTGGSPFVLHGSGTQGLDLVHVDDACRAVKAALDAPSLPPAINVGGGSAPAILIIGCVFSRVAAFHVESAREHACVEGLRRELDVSLAREALGWTPTTGLHEGAQGLVRMFGGAV